MRANDIINEADTVTVKNIKALLRDHPEAIFHLHDPSPALITYAAKNADYPEEILQKFKNKIGEDEWVFLIKEDPSMISEISNPSERLQLIAVREDPEAIGDIKKPTPRVQLAVLDSNPKSLRRVEKLDPTVIKLAIERGLSKYLPHVVDLTDAKTQLDAVKHNPKAVQYIKDTQPVVLKWLFNKNEVDVLVDAISNASLETIDGSKVEIIKFILRCIKNARDMDYPYDYPNMKSFLLSNKYSLIKWLIAKGVKWPELEVIANSLKALNAKALVGRL